MLEVAIRIVPDTGRAQHQVSCEKVDNLSKFILNHIKISMTIFPGMNRYKKYLLLNFSLIKGINANFDLNNMNSTDYRRAVVKKMLGFYQVKPNISDVIEDRISS